MRVGSLGWKDRPEEGVAIHCSILAWRIPETEEPSGLQSIESPRVGHNWSGLAHTRTYIYLGFLGGSVVKNQPASAGDTTEAVGLIPGS